MDPKSEINYSHIIGEAMELMYMPSMINASSGGAPEKAPRWILWIQKVTAVELGFWLRF